MLASSSVAPNREENPRAVGGDLPAYANDLIGRHQSISAIRGILARPNARLITLTGLGGTGKTRLAVHVASHDAWEFVDAVTFVDLSTLDDAELVPAAIARALDIGDPGDQPLGDRIAAAIGFRRWLLVLDNFERVLLASAIVVRLLVRCPALRILATSRVPLRIPGEFDIPIGPLATPTAQESTSLQWLATIDAAALFLERGRTVNPHLSLTDGDAFAVREICARLDGLPLALELAAYHLRFFVPQALAEALAHPLPYLRGGHRDGPARHRSMRDAIAWSVALLSEPAAAVFPRLAVFVGPWSVATADKIAILADKPGEHHHPRPATVIDAVLELAEHGLLRSAQKPGPEPGFMMLEVVREYALELLEATGTAAALRDAHCAVFAELAEEANVALTGSHQAGWMNRLHAEYGNLRSALSWALASGDGPTALRLGGALWPFWSRAGNLGEGRSWLERALLVAGPEATPAKAKAVQSLGNLALDVADYPEAAARFAESLDIYREVGNLIGVAAAQTGLGHVSSYQGDYAQAQHWHETCLAHLQTLGHRHFEAIALHNLGDLATAAGDPATAISYHHQALAIQQANGDDSGISYSTLSLAEATCDEGDIQAADSLFTHCLAQFERIGDQLGLGYARYGLGRVALDRGDFPAAAQHFGAALEMRRTFGVRRGIVECVEGLAAVATRTGSIEQAASLLAAAESTRDALRAALPASARTIVTQAIQATRDALDPATFSTRWKLGRVLTLDEAASLAASIVRTFTEPGSPPDLDPPLPTSLGSEAFVPDPYGLSPRERDVLRLLAQRLTDKEIAAALYVSPHTVHRHITNLFAKLGVSDRREAASLAVRLKLD